MKNKSNIFKIALIILTVILLGLILFFTLRKTREQELISPTSKIEKTAEVLDEASEIEEEGERILLFPKDEVYSFSMTDAQGIELNFQLNDDGKWIYVDNDSYEINQDRIDKLLNYITDIRFIDVISSEDGSKYGLDQNSPMYVISDANNNSTIMSLGNVNKEEGTVYFAINYDFTKIYVNQGKLYNIGAYTIQELIQ